MKFEEIKDRDLKSEITNDILRSLPEWFGIESAIVDYVNKVKEHEFIAVEMDNKYVGFISLKKLNRYTAEIYVLGILKSYHRTGIGHKLILKAEQKLRELGFKFFVVKTLGESHTDTNYQKTRLFYESVGFYPLEEIKEIWGEENPCLIMIKNI